MTQLCKSVMHTRRLEFYHWATSSLTCWILFRRLIPNYSHNGGAVGPLIWVKTKAWNNMHDCRSSYDLCRNQDWLIVLFTGSRASVFESRTSQSSSFHLQSSWQHSTNQSGASVSVSRVERPLPSNEHLLHQKLPLMLCFWAPAIALKTSRPIHPKSSTLRPWENMFMGWPGDGSSLCWTSQTKVCVWGGYVCLYVSVCEVAGWDGPKSKEMKGGGESLVVSSRFPQWGCLEVWVLQINISLISLKSTTGWCGLQVEVQLVSLRELSRPLSFCHCSDWLTDIHVVSAEERAWKIILISSSSMLCVFGTTLDLQTWRPGSSMENLLGGFFKDNPSKMLAKCSCWG